MKYEEIKAQLILEDFETAADLQWRTVGTRFGNDYVGFWSVEYHPPKYSTNHEHGLYARLLKLPTSLEDAGEVAVNVHIEIKQLNFNVQLKGHSLGIGKSWGQVRNEPLKTLQTSQTEQDCCGLPAQSWTAQCRFS